MRHLFLAPLASAFGEALQGIRLAAALQATGDEVVFLAPAKLHPLIDSAKVTFGRIDLALPRLDEQISGLIERLHCDTLVLVDAAAMGKVALALDLAPAAFTRAEVPVLALDCWNLPELPLRWDYGTHGETLSPEFHRLKRRLQPVPVAPPSAPGAYTAFPPVLAIDRQKLRAELGLSLEDRLLLWPSASWQHAENQTQPHLGRLAAALPRLVLPQLARLGRRVKILHVGPLPFAPAGTRGYRHLGPVDPLRFEALVSAADALLSFNAVATSLVTAMAAGVPIVLGQTSLEATTMAQAEEALGARLSPAVRAFIAANLPLHPMRAWPLGLSTVLRSTVDENPFYQAMTVVDPLDEEAFVAAVQPVLFAPNNPLAEAQERYRRLLALLPTGPERFHQLLQVR